MSGPLFVLLLLIGSPAANAGYPLESLLTADSEFWGSSRQAFIKKHAEHGFEWTSASQDTARSYKAPIRFLKLVVWEAKVQFANSRPTLLSMSIYNRGDAGDLSEGAFKNRFQQTRSRLEKWTKRRALKRQTKKDARSRKQIEQWRTSEHDVLLTGSYSTKDADGRPAFRAEYIRVDVTPRRQDHRGGASAVTAKPKKPVKTPDGGVFIDGVPMVDQGEKGYCVVATAERVFKYYGIHFDQHELAQMGSSSAQRGTDMKTMLTALKRTGRKMGWNVTVIEQYRWSEFSKLLHQYNRQAKRHKRRIVDPDSAGTLLDIYRMLDFELFKKVKLQSTRDYRNFQTDVAKHINRGKPLAWTLIVGLVAENPPVRSIEGHMRLIIGYHPKKNLLYYSDSWGAGHERKEMRFDDAWAVTTGLSSIEPR